MCNVLNWNNWCRKLDFNQTSQTYAFYPSYYWCLVCLIWIFHLLSYLLHFFLLLLLFIWQCHGDIIWGFYENCEGLRNKCAILIDSKNFQLVIIYRRFWSRWDQKRNFTSLVSYCDELGSCTYLSINRNYRTILFCCCHDESYRCVSYISVKRLVIRKIVKDWLLLLSLSAVIWLSGFFDCNWENTALT